MRGSALKTLRRQMDDIASINRTNVPLAFFQPITARELLECEAGKMIGSNRPPALLDIGLFGHRADVEQFSLFGGK